MKTARDIEKEKQDALLQSAVDFLAEHFDTVQIVCTQSYCGMVDSHYSKGCGSFYARLASLQELLWRDEARTKHDAITEISTPPPDDSESWQFL